MDAIEASDVFNIRPDIFIRGAEDRLHLQYHDQNFILRLPRAVIASIYHFLELNDGSRTVAAVLEHIPAAHRGAMHKFLGFLLQKGAAFRVRTPEDEAVLAPVAHTLTYLRAYCDDAAAAFTRFADQRILLAGGGFALSSAVKTLARLGVRSLGILQTGIPGEPTWRDAELAACFDAVRAWPDAGVVCHQNGVQAAHGYTQLLAIGNDAALALPRLAATLPQARTGCAMHVDGRACIGWDAQALDLAGLAAAHAGDVLAPAEALVAGAVAALACFDHLCGLRSLAPGQYHHYGLEGEGMMHVAALRTLVPLDQPLQQTAENTVAARLDELAAAPLFPLRPMVQDALGGSYIKLYRASFRAPASTAGQPHGPWRTVSGAGLTRAQCRTSLLAQLVCRADVWFSPVSPEEAAQVVTLRARYRAVAAAIAAADPVVPAGPGSAGDGDGPNACYVGFCIHAAFGVRVVTTVRALGPALPDWPVCTVLAAGSATVYLPHAGLLPDSQHEAGLLALYAALHAGRQPEQGAGGPDIVFDGDPFGPPGALVQAIAAESAAA